MRDWSIAAATRDTLGEGPWWVARKEAVYWVDLLGKRLNSLGLRDNKLRTWAMPDLIGFVIPKGSGGLIVGLRTGVYKFDETSSALTPLVDPHDDPQQRLNDGVTDPLGNLWLGTMAINGDTPVGGLIRVSTKLEVTKADTNYYIPNGPCFNKGFSIMYHADSYRRQIFRFSVDEGFLKDRALHIEFKPEWGLPDGMTVDSEDHLWVAHWGGGRISRFDPEGHLVRTIELPASNVTSCAFGGPALDRLFVTSASYKCEHEPLAGALFEVEPGATGFPLTPFGGSI